MKAIIVGATGFIGNAILRRALETPAITSIVSLARRDLPAEADVSSDPKIKNIIVPDFANISPDALKETQGAGICYWAMGGRLFQFPSLAEARLANVSHLHTFASFLVTSLTSTLQSSNPTSPNPTTSPPFRFVYLSGAFTCRDPSMHLLFLSDSRKLKGEAETGLLRIEAEHPGILEVLIARPAGVLERYGGLMGLVYGPVGIGKEVLAAAMVEMGLRERRERRGRRRWWRTRS